MKLTASSRRRNPCYPAMSTHTFLSAAGRPSGLPFTRLLHPDLRHKSCTSGYLPTDGERSFLLTLKAAPPCMMDLIKIPMSVPVSLDLFPFKLTPRPAEPESFRGISKVSWSVVSGERARQSGSPFCWGDGHEKSGGKKAG